MLRSISFIGYAFIATITMSSSCSKSQSNNGGGGTTTTPALTADWWLTKGDRSALMQQQAGISFGTTATSTTIVDVDSATRYQSIDGFGYTLTGGSASLINQLDAANKSALLTELFGTGTNGIGISYLRLSIGASDLSSTVFSYDDLPAGQTDLSLAQFSLSKDTTDLIPVLKQILAINPQIKILGSPWSAPLWMKDNGSSMGGGLLPQYYSVYSKYFVKYIQAMAAKGITIDAVTLQNEPQHGGNNPSMVMSAANQAEFVKSNLGPAFQAAAINTKIIVWDHNCDNPTFPVTVLDDAGARQFIDGSAFHLYNGDISALSIVHNAYPNKNLYFTEQWTGANGSFDGDLRWHVTNVVIGSMRNWSRNALEWNLAADAAYNPHTPGGCTECKGALTISGSSVSRNVGYYIIAHASKFVPAGSVRIGSTEAGAIKNAAFLTPTGKKVLVVMNDSNTSTSFNIKYQGKWASAQLPAGAAATFTW
ncbi:MAG: glycoside hydrolase family 30 beta sandwich domain-containing protein [Chitinophagaceae bacterium]